MTLPLLTDDARIRHDLTGLPDDLVVSVGDVANRVALEAAKRVQRDRILAARFAWFFLFQAANPGTLSQKSTTESAATL